MNINVLLIYLGALFLLILFFKLIKIVPEQEAFVIEEFGKFKKILGSGLHLLIPFVQKSAYKQTLKEQVIDVEPQVCITKDNVQVTVDGILYLKIVDPEKASYGIQNYRYATAQLAKTTMRSEIGKMDLDRSFSERDILNNAIVKAVDEASDPWGIKVTRYEIKDISPTEEVQKAMEQQMRAEREKRAEILSSEGAKVARINISQGDKEKAINVSKGEKLKRINEAEGRAQAMEITADATAKGIREIAEAVKLPGGGSAVSLYLVEQYIEKFSNIIDSAETTVLPYEAAKIKGILQSILPEKKKGGVE
jgi:regulator of protease activity HflC (stomatin/prohibitin superfamily)